MPSGRRLWTATATTATTAASGRTFRWRRSVWVNSRCVEGRPDGRSKRAEAHPPFGTRPAFGAPAAPTFGQPQQPAQSGFGKPALVQVTFCDQTRQDASSDPEPPRRGMLTRTLPTKPLPPLPTPLSLLLRQFPLLHGLPSPPRPRWLRCARRHDRIRHASPGDLDLWRSRRGRTLWRRSGHGAIAVLFRRYVFSAVFALGLRRRDE